MKAVPLDTANYISGIGVERTFTRRNEGRASRHGELFSLARMEACDCGAAMKAVPLDTANLDVVHPGGILAHAAMKAVPLDTANVAALDP